jgi:excisionase family DNA binding protein
MNEKLISAKEAAGILGITESEVRRLSEKGQLPAYLIGEKFMRFRQAEVLGIKERAEVRSAAADRRPLGERLRDFISFYDYYVVSFLITAAIIGYVIYGIMKK